MTNRVNRTAATTAPITIIISVELDVEESAIETLKEFDAEPPFGSVAVKVKFNWERPLRLPIEGTAPYMNNVDGSKLIHVGMFDPFEYFSEYVRRSPSASEKRFEPNDFVKLVE